MLKLAAACTALLVSTWAWFVRHIVMRRLNQMEIRMSSLESGAVKPSDIEDMKREMKGVSERIDAHLLSANTNLNEAQKVIFGKIERTENKIEATHDRIMAQLNVMVELLKNTG
jgi:biopolymer transport protein ExbB/TolQ